MAGIYVYPSDGYLRFQVGAIDLTINANSFSSESQGQTPFERYGFDIMPSRKRFRTAQPNYSGAFHFEGAPYAAGYEMTFNPQRLKQGVKAQLIEIEKLNQYQSCLFYNKLIPIQETGSELTRNRAKIGDFLPPEAPNTILFFPIMKIYNFKIISETAWQQENSYKNAWTLETSFEEGDLDAPVPTSADIA